MPQPASREHEPTSLGWIFGGVFGVLLAGAGLAARRLWRRGAAEVVVEELPLPTHPAAHPDRRDDS